MHVREEHRRRGVGTWLVRHAVAWLRLAGCERIVLCVPEEDEQAGAGAFYRRFGWDVLSRGVNGWRRP
jgi:GNAT superfamily N-acetyltransferase